MVCRRGDQRSLWAETAPIDAAGQGPLTFTLATFAVTICNGCFTSIRDVAETSQMRKYRSFADRGTNGSTRPKGEVSARPPIDRNDAKRAFLRSQADPSRKSHQ
jgi:hypothetical protein